MSAYKISYQKGDNRYYVSLDGQKVGWVSKDHDGKWACWATVNDAITGTRLAYGFATRRDAVMEAISALRIWHLGRIMTLNFETYKDEAIYLDTDRLEATWNAMLEEKYS